MKGYRLMRSRSTQLLLLFYALIAFFITFGKADYQTLACQNDTGDCNIQFNGEVDPSIIWNFLDSSRKVLITDSVILCVHKNCTLGADYNAPQQCCQINISTDKSVVIMNSTLIFSSIYIKSGTQIEIDDSSLLNTTGMGYMNGPGHDNNTGAHYAAEGGWCGNIEPTDKTYGTYYMQATDLDRYPIDWQFGSGGGNTRSIGGGRIALISKSYTINGKIEASGLPVVANTSSTVNVNGGSGGYIYMEFTGNENDTLTINNNIYAIGGIYDGSGTGGSGGRIVLNINDTYIQDPTKFKAYGGKLETIVSPNGCNFGGAGTIYFAVSNRLQIGSDYQATLTAKTMIQNTDPKNLSFWNVAEVHVSSYSVVSFPLTNNTISTNESVSQLQKLTIDTNGVLKPPYSQTLSLNNLTFTMILNNFTVNAGSIFTQQALSTKFIVNDTFYLDSTSQFVCGKYLSIHGDNITLLGYVQLNQLSPNSKLQDPMDIGGNTFANIYAVTIFQMIMTSPNTFKTDYLFLFSENDALIQGSITSSVTFNSCNQNDREVFSFVQDRGQLPLQRDQLLRNFISQFNITWNQTEQDYTVLRLSEQVTTNFTVTMIVLNNLTIASTGQIKSPRIGAYANIFNIYGNISSSTLGCKCGKGLGKGLASSSNCTATGGAFGGRGGYAVNYYTRKTTEELELYKPLKQGEDPYSDKMCQYYRPTSYGSYDSPILIEGSGGGQYQTTATGGQGGGIVWIQANTLTHQGYIAANGGNGATSYAGGGSGGSIYLAINSLQGSGQIQSIGGNGLTGGGGGSGGRVKIFYFSWFDSSSYSSMAQNAQIQVSVKGGKGQDQLYGDNGTIWSTPCSSGFYGIFCKPCANGTYKIESANIDCLPCNNIPEEALGNAYYTSPGWTNPLCPYACNPKLTSIDQNPYCLDDFNLFVQNMGGIQIFIIIIIATVFGIFAVMYFLQFSSSSKNQFEDTEIVRLKKGFEELDFIDQNLHQHICRVYMLGTNELYSQWSLPTVPPIQIRNRIYLNKYNEFVERVNNCDKRSKTQRFLHILIMILYPALLPFYAKTQRKKHQNKFKQALINEADKIDFWKSVDDKMSIELRFTSTEDYTLGYLDFIDIKKTKVSYDGPVIPMTILVGGLGTFSCPYSINQQDPLVKSVSYYLNDNRIWDMFIANLNSQLLQLSLSNFAFHARWKLLKVVDYIYNHSHKLFEPYGIKVSLWLLEVKAANNEQGFSFMGRIEPEEDYFVLSHKYLHKKRQTFVNLIDYWRTEQFFNNKKRNFKLALIVTRKDDRLETQISQVISQRSKDLGDVGKKISSSKKKKSSSGNKKKDSNQRHISGDSPATTPKHGAKAPTSRVQNRVTNDPDGANQAGESYVQLQTFQIREIHIDHKKIKELKSYNNTWKYYLKSLVLFPVALIKGLTLRHSDVVRWFQVTVILYIIFVVLDVILTFQIFVVLYIPTGGKSIDWDAWPFIGFYPLASIIAPIMAILSFMLCKPYFYRAVAYMNSLSLFTNVLVFAIIEFVLVLNKSNSFYFNMTLYGVIVLIKLIVAQLLMLQIAYFRNPKYYVYQNKLTECLKDAEKLEMDEINLVMEQSNDNQNESTSRESSF